jgi:VWFA-related protein
MSISSLRLVNRYRRRLCPSGFVAWLVCASLLLALSFASAEEDSKASNSKPSAVIDIAGVGYPQLSRTDRLGEDANETLDFVDESHVLFTFNPKKLFQRHPDCPPSHDDRLIRAVILEIPSGKIVQIADWYLHDHRRYLWSMGPGKFLLRRLNSLYVVDAALHENLLLQSPKDLLWVSVTPDHSQVVVETAEDLPKPLSTESSSIQEARTKPGFVVQFLDSRSLSPQQTLKLSAQVNLDGTTTGYADTIHKGDLWLVRFGPSPEQRRNIARVRSRGVPRIWYSSSNSLLIGRCCSASGEYSVSAFTTSGHRLWRQHWDRDRYVPVVAGTADDSRVAISTLSHVPYAGGAVDTTDEENPNFSLEQTVQVLETASGTAVKSVMVNPVVMSGQNFSLSPDGRKLTVLAESAIQVYDLRPISVEEQAKFSALKADVPGLYTLPKDSDGASDQPASANNEPQPTSPAPSIAPAISAALPSSASPSPEEPPAKAEGQGSPLTTFRLNMQAVAVDVVVTDAKGHPVKGLRQEDFQLSEDGNGQKIRSFHEYSEEVPKNTAPAKQAPNMFSNATDNPAGATMLVLLDLLNTPSQDQLYARDQLIKFLKARAAEGKTSQFALCTLTGDQNSHLHLVQGFTSDENKLLAAASGNRSVPNTARWQTAEQGIDKAANRIKDLAANDPMNSWGTLLHGIEAIQTEEQTTDTDARVGITLNAMMQLAGYLSGIPGRKNVVWLSGSFPIASFNNDLQNPMNDNRNYSGRVHLAAKLLADSQVAVYPVDVRGMDTGKISVANSSVGLGPGSQGTAVAPGIIPVNGDSVVSPYIAFQQDAMQDLARRTAERTALNQMASDTGGTAFFSSNAIADAIKMATEQASNYYSLSYSPSNKNYDGRFRKLKVALAEKGYRLHYRPGYFAEDPNSPAKMKEVAHNIRVVAMQYGSPQSHQIRFSVRVVPVGTRAKVDSAKAGEILLASAQNPTLPSQVDVQHHSIDYAIDSSDLRFLPLSNGTYRSALTFMIASFAPDGRPLSGVSSVGMSDLRPEVYKDAVTGGVRVHQEVDVPVAATSMRIGIQDQLSNYVGTIDLSLPIPAPPDVPRVVKSQLPAIEPD